MKPQEEKECRSHFLSKGSSEGHPPMRVAPALSGAGHRIFCEARVLQKYLLDTYIDRNKEK